MNEQQRFLLSLFCCMSIWFGWQYWTGGLQPPPTPPAHQGPAASENAPVALDARAKSSSAAAGLNAARVPSTLALPRPSARQSFSTAMLHGEVQDVDAALTALRLPAFAPRLLENDPEETAEGIAMMPERAGRAGALDQAGLRVLVGGEQVALRFVPGEQLVLRGGAKNGSEVHLRLLPDPSRYALGYELEVVNGGSASQTVAADLTLALAPLDALEPDGQDQDRKPFAGLRRYFGGAGRSTDRLRGLLADGGKLSRKDFAAAKKAGSASAQSVEWAAIDEQYFLLAWVPTDGLRGKASLFTRDDTLGLGISYEPSSLAPGERWRRSFQLFAGPKRDAELAAVDARLQESIDYTFLSIPLGFLARPMVALLRTFHGVTHSWGTSILLLTLVVKLLLLPVVYKSVTSIRRMQEIKPELDRIKARHAGDQERLQAEQMRLFKENGVNPVSGCLPLLLQMPVWLTLYRTLWGAVDLYRQPFLWLHDLTAREPIPYLALAVGAVTYVQQKVTPMAVDNQQARVMMVMMPVLVMAFMVNMPSGLVLYILANSVLTIVQQLVIHNRAATPTKATVR